MVKNGDSSHKIYYTDMLSEILNPEGHQNCCITTILLNVWILPTGAVSSARVCACSVHSRLVLLNLTIYKPNCSAQVFQPTATVYTSPVLLPSKPPAGS